MTPSILIAAALVGMGPNEHGVNTKGFEDGLPDSMTLSGVIRDFKVDHPDFEAYPGSGVKQMVTDELGAEAVDCVHHVRDVHVTLLHLLGLDDNKLTYFHGGRFKQLSQFGGQIIPELLG